MKKIVMITLAVAMTFATLSVSAKEYEYGEYVGNPTSMEGTVTNNYTFHNAGGYTTNKSDERAHSGKYSFKVDLTSSTGECIFERHANNTTDSNLDKGILYFEAYASGYTNKPTALSFHNRYSNMSQTSTNMPNERNVTFGEMDNGWQKVSQVIYPVKDPEETFGSISFCMYYYNNNTSHETDAIYYDDMSVRFLPVSMSVENCTTEKSTVKLKDLRIKGIDIDGKATDIKYKDLINFTILSGNAYIDKNKNLNFVGTSNARVKADMFGVVSTEFNVEYVNQVSTSVSNNDDGTYTATVVNDSDTGVTATMIVCLYNGDRLSMAKTYNVSVDKNSSGTVTSEKIDVPFYVSNPIYKTFCMADR